MNCTTEQFRSQDSSLDMLPARAVLSWGAFEVSWKDATRWGAGKYTEPQVPGPSLSWQSNVLLNKSKDKVHLHLLPWTWLRHCGRVTDPVPCLSSAVDQAVPVHVWYCY